MDDVIPVDDPKEFSKRDDNNYTDAVSSLLNEQVDIINSLRLVIRYQHANKLPTNL